MFYNQPALYKYFNSKFGTAWANKFKEYFQIAEQLMRAQPDEQDLAFMAVLITLTADRHESLTPPQRTMICSLQV